MGITDQSYFQFFSVTASTSTVAFPSAYPLSYDCNGLNPSLTEQISIIGSTLSSVAYQVGDPLETYSFDAYDYTTCSTEITYSLLNQDTTAFDSSVFSFDSTALSVSVSTSDAAKAATYLLGIQALAGDETHFT